MMLIKALLLLLVGSVVCETSTNTDCPEFEVKKCTCTPIQAGSSITCSGEFTHEEAVKVIHVLKDYKINMLTIANMTFAKKRYDYMFDFFEIDHIVLDNVTVTGGFDDDEMKYISNIARDVKTIQIRNSFRDGVQPAHIRWYPMTRLQSLSIVNSSILEIGNDWFARGPIKLESLILENNKIQRFGNATFRVLNYLKNLRVKNCSLKVVNASMFPAPASRLENLELQNNQLKELPVDLFSNMTDKLQFVSISNNNITSIPKKIWPSKLENTRLDLDGNPFRCDDDLKWVCDIKANTEDAFCASPAGFNGTKLSMDDFCFV